MIELLVVIVIIGLLAAILLSAINMARETARRGHCVSRQRDLALAMIDYSVSNNGLPGYLNQLGETPIHSWAIAIMPGIGEAGRYAVLMKPAPSEDELRRSIAPLSALICPSDNPRENGRLNYIVNCGPASETNNFQDFMLFKDRRYPLTSTNVRYHIEEIPDGASNTILLSENVLFPNNQDASSEPGFWYIASTDANGARHNWPSLSQVANPRARNMEDVNHLGFVWARSSEYLPLASVSATMRGVAGTTVRARPSSRHPGTVVAGFADGSARVINDDIAIDDWLRAVCPDDNGWN